MVCFKFLFLSYDCLLHFRSPLLTESRLITFPIVTEMFHFTTFSFSFPGIIPLGDQWITASYVLPIAFRNLERPFLLTLGLL
jgi:hypothetical protein